MQTKARSISFESQTSLDSINITRSFVEATTQRIEVGTRIKKNNIVATQLEEKIKAVPEKPSETR